MRLRTMLGSALVIALMGTACADTADTGTGDDGDTGPTHPAGANELVLRIHDEGGFVPVEYTLSTPPGTSVFGDGTVVTNGPQIMIYPGPALPNLIATPLTDEGLQALVAAAIDAGLLESHDYLDLGSMAVTDVPTTVFTLVADGETHVTRVYAMGFLTEQPAGMSGEEFAARQALEAFAAKLGALRDWLPEGSVGEDGSFTPHAMRGYVGEYRPDPELTQVPIEWPLDAGLATAGEAVPVADRRCLVVEGSELDTLLPLAEEANQLTPWTSDGERYSIVFRPLLPDESGC